MGSLKIFLNYRRGEASDAAGRIHATLAPHFGSESIFLDVDHMPPGVNFVEYLDDKVAACDVLIAVISPTWLAVKDRSGRLLDAPSDFVRIEIEAALRRNLRVIPVLVRNAKMPKPDQLPESIRALAFRNAVDLTHEHFQKSIGRLIAGLQDMDREKANRERAAREAAERAEAERAAAERAERERVARARAEEAEREAEKQEADERQRALAQAKERERAELERAEQIKLERDTVAGRLAALDGQPWDALDELQRRRYFDLIDVARDPKADAQALASKDGHWWGKLGSVERAHYRSLLAAARRGP